MSSCQICCESFNLRTRIKVSCGYCNLEACRACVQQYLVGIVDDPHCMQCKNAWNREFVDQVQWKPLETVVSDFVQLLLHRRPAPKPSETAT
jgi:hypothetical protein